MDKNVHAAFAAFSAATAAVDAAQRARDLHEYAPDDWSLIDSAYWLCRAAQDACERAQDNLDPNLADRNEGVRYAHALAAKGEEAVCEAADNLVCLAQTVNHEISR